LEDWGYPDGISICGNNNYKVEQVEYQDLERMGLSDSEGKTHNDVGHGGGNSSGSTSLAKKEC
jgi:hypothetical protein